MSDHLAPPSAEEAHKMVEALFAATRRFPTDRVNAAALTDFIDYHDGCREREASFQVTIEEQQRDLEAAQEAQEQAGQHW